MRFHVIKLVCFVILSAVVYPSLQATIISAEEYNLKAIYIIRFPVYVTWPEEAFKDSGDKLLLGVLGKDEVGSRLKELEKGKITVKERRIVVEKLSKKMPLETLSKYHLLYIGPSLKSRLPDILKSIEKKPVLTVGVGKGFAEQGGIIELVTKGEYVKFVINKTAAERVGIRISSKLLRLAIRLIEDSNAGQE